MWVSTYPRDHEMVWWMCEHLLLYHTAEQSTTGYAVVVVV